MKQYLYIKSGNQIRKVNHKDIEYAIVEGRYIKIKYRGNFILVHSSMKEFQNKLPGNFIKVHQSYLVNEEKIEYVDLRSNTLYLENGESFTINRAYRKQLLDESIR